MTAAEAKKAMLSFLEKHHGRSVLFGTLSDDDKLAFVLVKSFEYFKFLPAKDRIMRAIGNAEAHRRSGYDCWADDRAMVIPADFGKGVN